MRWESGMKQQKNQTGGIEPTGWPGSQDLAVSGGIVVLFAVYSVCRDV